MYLVSYNEDYSYQERKMTLRQLKDFKYQIRIGNEHAEILHVQKLSNNLKPNKKMARKKSSYKKKTRTGSKAQRKNLYDWAWKQKGKGSLKRIGKKMQSISRAGGMGSKKTVRVLGKIADQKKAFAKGYKKRK